MTPYNGVPVPITDPLVGRSRSWDPAYDDPAYRQLVAELGVPGLLSGVAGTIVRGEVIG